MANDTIIRGSDLDIKLKLYYNGAPITDLNKLDFIISSFDSYNHGKIWKYIPEDIRVLQDNTIVIRFPAAKQKFVGYYNVLCDVNIGTQEVPVMEKISFKHCFYLDDEFLPSPEPIDLGTKTIEVSSPVLSGEISVVSLVKEVEYIENAPEGYPVIRIKFTNDDEIRINATNLFPFRVVSELPEQVMNNVFYYTYEGTTETWTVATLVSPQGGGTVSGAGAIEKQTFCTLTATPATGYTFVNWTSPSWEQPVTTNPYAFKPESDITVTANFSNPVYFDDNGNLMFGSTTVATFDDATGTLVINTTAFPNARFRDEDNTLVLIPAQ